MNERDFMDPSEYAEAADNFVRSLSKHPIDVVASSQASGYNPREVDVTIFNKPVRPRTLMDILPDRVYNSLQDWRSFIDIVKTCISPYSQ